MEINPFSSDISYGNDAPCDAPCDAPIDEAPSLIEAPITDQIEQDEAITFSANLINKLQERPPVVRRDLVRRIKEYAFSAPMSLISKPALRKLNNDRRDWIMEVTLECFDPDNELLDKHGYTSNKYIGSLQRFLKETDKSWHELHPLGKDIKLEDLMVTTILTENEKKQLKSRKYGEFYHRDVGWY